MLKMLIKEKYAIINTKESLNDEIVDRPIVVLENTKESLNDETVDRPVVLQDRNRTT